MDIAVTTLLGISLALDFKVERFYSFALEESAGEVFLTRLSRSRIIDKKLFKMSL